LGAKWDKVHRVYRRDFAGLTTLSP
jgi:hypothetical protein